MYQIIGNKDWKPIISTLFYTLFNKKK